MEGLVGELLEPFLLGRPQRGVLDHERSFERQLLDQPPLLVAPGAGSLRVAEDHEPERPRRRHERHHHIGLERQRVDQVRREQPARARVLDEDRLGLAGGDPPCAEVPRGDAAGEVAEAPPRTCRSAPTVSDVLDPVLLVAQQQRRGLGLDRLTRDAGQHLSRLDDGGRRARPLPAGGGSPSRRAGASCARRWCVPARSWARRAPAADAARRTSSLENRSGAGVVEHDHTDHVRRRAERHGQQGLDREAARSPGSHQRVVGARRRPRARPSRRRPARRAAARLPHRVPLGDVAGAVGMAGRARDEARRPRSSSTVARRAPSARAMRSHTTISISSSDGAFVAASVSSSRKEVSDWWRSLSTHAAGARHRGRDHGQEGVELGACVTRGRLDRDHPDGAAGDQRLERARSSCRGRRPARPGCGSSSWASSISTGRDWSSTGDGRRHVGEGDAPPLGRELVDPAAGLSTARGVTACRGAS